jgi:hypothetical protein
MTYSVKEIYYTLQGEGANVGGPLSSADLQDAIFGRAMRKSEQLQSASSVTLNLWVLMALVVESLKSLMHSPTPFGENGGQRVV